MSEEEAVALLSGRIGMAEVRAVVEWVSEARGRRERLMEWMHSEDRRLSVNALWTITHLPAEMAQWLMRHRDMFADMLLAEEDVSKKRMLLGILRDMDYGEEDVRADLLDYCLSKINAECEPYAVRCFSLYTAFRMCRLFPELLDELEIHMEMLGGQSMSPGLLSAWRKTRRDMEKCRVGKRRRKV